jgi:membrane associated rhomboid family serine protease
MLVVPYVKIHKKMSLPIATLLLVIVNIVIYNIQSLADWHFEAAVKFYISSDLAGLEFPVLAKLDARIYPTNSAGIPTLPESDEAGAYAGIVRRTLASKSAQLKLRNDEIVDTKNPNYAKWKSQRNKFNQLLKGACELNYGFVPADKGKIWYTALTSTFLHMDAWHLIGNMVLLIIIGIALEGVIGFWATLLLFLATGTASSWVDYFSRPDSFEPAIGASGAVYGFMGAFAVVFGFRWIRAIVFIIFPILFKRLSVPAALLLLYWFGVEYVSYRYFRGDSNTSFISHLGGLVIGAMIALCIRPFRRELLDAIDE